MTELMGLTVPEVNGIEEPRSCFTNCQRPVRTDLEAVPEEIDLIVSDRQAECLRQHHLQHANLVGSGGSVGHINILALDATLEIGAENPKPPSKDQRVSKRAIALADGIRRKVKIKSGPAHENHYQQINCCIGNNAGRIRDRPRERQGERIGHAASKPTNRSQWRNLRLILTACQDKPKQRENAPDSIQ
jgi:hypothetical protein